MPAALLAGIALMAGCGGSAEPRTISTDGGKPSALGPTDVTKVQEGMPKERVLAELGPPVVAQGPIDDYAGGCLFYPVKDVPLVNVWQFCFDAAGLTFVTTATAGSHPRVSR